MSEGSTGIRISKKAFVTSFLVLLVLMLAAGILTLAVPSGSYQRISGEYGVQVVADTYRQTEKTSYPFWRWLAAPLEVLGGEDGLQALVIILFILIVGGSFAILDRAQALKETVSIISRKFASRRYLLLGLVTFFFMSIGSLLGIFEETIPLVPVAIALATSLGWDLNIGLGMSILATGFGFSAAIANPFSIGVAQRLAGLGLFSGLSFRILIFLCVYLFFFAWLAWMAKRSERGLPGASGAGMPPAGGEGSPVPHPRRGAIFLGISLLLLLVVILAISLTQTFAEYAMPIIALIFLVAGIGSGLAAGLGVKKCLSSFIRGLGGILPGVILILMAMAVKHIIVTGGIMDTILHGASALIRGSSGYASAALIYLITLVMNFFIGSATAKAFLLMPILAPLADLTGISRQLAVQAFAFGDGFSNMLYPTNAVLLIALGIAGISWTAWFRKTWALQAGTLALTLALLMLGVLIGYR